MLEAGDRILTGVSGGADSVCLLFLLHEIQKHIPITLRVVHVCHGIRKEAGEDADYVKSLCEKLAIPFEREDVDVPTLAKKEGLSEEEAGRRARYEIFETKAKAWLMEEEANLVTARSTKPTSGSTKPTVTYGRVKIALAHHAGDRAETLLFNLFRGSGLKGLASIPPMRETKAAGVTVIRPLLCLTREEIEEYLAEKKIAYCQDATNAGDEYARNRIRHHILPYAEQEICHGATAHLNQAAELLAETEEYLRQQTSAARKACVGSFEGQSELQFEGLLEGQSKEHSKELRITCDSFDRFPALIQKRLLLELLLELSPGAKDIGAVHVEMVRKLFYGESGREADLPFGIHARREYDQVILERSTDPEARGEGDAADLMEKEEKISLSELAEKGFLTIPWGEDSFLFHVLPYEKKDQIPEKTYTKWFDYDKIKNTLSIRTRRSGDYLMIRGGDGCPVRKRLKEYFITEKLPRRHRETLPLLVEEGHVLWITGHRISEAYKVEEHTKTILQVEWKRKWRTKDGGACQGTDI
jgi:tRNA(Ile)-lysidine synthase